MKQHSANLRQAFAANPSRFLAVASSRPVAGEASGSLAESKLLHHVLTVRPSTDHPLSGRLRDLGLPGMAQAVSRMNVDGAADETSLEQTLSLLIEAETADRNKRQLAQRLRNANLRYQASIADLDYGAIRGFDDALFHQLATGQWIAGNENVVIDGPTGVGKTWLACALGEKACRDGRSVRYERVPQLMADLAALHGDARYASRMRKLQAAELLILDDWGMEPFSADQRVEMFEVLDRRCGQGSTLIASQHPVEAWSRIIGGSTTATVLLDRIIHNAHRLQLKGKSLRDRAPV